MALKHHQTLRKFDVKEDIKNKIRKSIELYFESMYESSPEKVRKVFHGSAKITGYMQEKLIEHSVSSFADFVGSQTPSAKEKNEKKFLEILSIEIAGSTAVARVRDGYLGMTFLDTLSFIKVEDKWVIYNKLFYVET